MKEKLKRFLLDQHYLSIEILKHINSICDKLGFPFVLIGAQARDLILTGKYGLTPGTTTHDIDLAIMVRDWADFNQLKDDLFKNGFAKVNGTEHKFCYKDAYTIDIVPFGKIEDNGQIAWPPDNDPKMSVVGFQEMYDNSEVINIDDDLSLNVASLAGLTMIKLIAWNDRRYSIKKDGEDLALIMKDYADAGNLDRLYDGNDNDIVQDCAFDLELAGAQLLGRDIARIAGSKTKHSLLSILEKELDGDNDLLIETMLANFSENYDLTRDVLLSFRKGILSYNS